MSREGSDEALPSSAGFLSPLGATTLSCFVGYLQKSQVCYRVCDLVHTGSNTVCPRDYRVWTCRIESSLLLT